MLYLGGGDKPHIGTVIISQPRSSMRDSNVTSCTTSVINRLSHKDDSIITPIAEAICKKTDSMVVASGGVHIDNASEEDIKRLIHNMEEIKDKLMNRL